MKALLALAVVVGTTAPLVLRAAQQGTPIRIRVYNYAGLDHAILLAAQKQTAAVLSAAGIAAEWAGCSVVPAETGKIRKTVEEVVLSFDGEYRKRPEPEQIRPLRLVPGKHHPVEEQPRPEVRHEFPDLRELWRNDLRFVRQF